jgi:hypothetical protein
MMTQVFSLYTTNCFFDKMYSSFRLRVSHEHSFSPYVSHQRPKRLIAPEVRFTEANELHVLLRFLYIRLPEFFVRLKF